MIIPGAAKNPSGCSLLVRLERRSARFFASPGMKGEGKLPEAVNKKDEAPQELRPLKMRFVENVCS